MIGRVLKSFRPLADKQYIYLAIILIVSILLRLIYIILFEADITQGVDPWYRIRTAQGIINGHGYSTGNLMAYQPPLFATFIAGVFTIFGESIEAVRIIQSLMGTMMCFAVFLIGKKCLSIRTGLIASAICAVYPQLIHYSVQLWSEQLFVFLIILAILAFLISEKKSSIPWKITTGIFLGLSALTREVAVFVLFGFLIYFIVSYKNLLRSLKQWWIIAIFTILTILPWTIRNYTIFKTFVPISTNSGTNFYIGNNPKANGTFKWVFPPGVTPGINWDVKSPNGICEIRASSLGYKYGLKFIRNNPGQFIRLIAKRAFYQLRTPYYAINFKESKFETIAKLQWLVMYIILFIFSFFIGPFYLRYGPKCFYLFLVTISMFMLPHLITFGYNRYILPAIPLMALITAIILDKIFASDKKLLFFLTFHRK